MRSKRVNLILYFLTKNCSVSVSFLSRFLHSRNYIHSTSWVESCACLWETILKANFAVKEDTLCMKCREEPAVIRCNECFTAKYLCGSCDQKVHELLPYHNRDAVVNGHYEPIPPTLSKNYSGEWVTIGEYKFPVKGPAVFEV